MENDIKNDKEKFIGILEKSFPQKFDRAMFENDEFDKYFKLLFLYRKSVYKMFGNEEYLKKFSDSCGIILYCGLLILEGNDNVALAYGRAAMDQFIRGVALVQGITIPGEDRFKFSYLLDQSSKTIKTNCLGYGHIRHKKKKKFNRISEEYSQQIKEIYWGLSQSVHIKADVTLPDVLQEVIANQNNKINFPAFSKLNDELIFFIEYLILIDKFYLNLLPDILVSDCLRPLTSEKFKKYFFEIAMF